MSKNLDTPGTPVQSTGLSAAIPSDAVSASCTLKAKSTGGSSANDVTEFRLGGRAGDGTDGTENATWNAASILARIDVHDGATNTDYKVASPIELPMPLKELTFWGNAEQSAQTVDIAVNFLKADGTTTEVTVTWP